MNIEIGGLFRKLASAFDLDANCTFYIVLYGIYALIIA